MAIDLFCEAVGAGHPLILIPGLSDTRLSWFKQVHVLSQAYRVVTIDNRDAGRSPLAAGPYSIADMAGDVAALMDREGIERAHIVGISMGGFIALHLALAAPHRIARLILISTSPGGPAHVQAGPELDEALKIVKGEGPEARLQRIMRFLTAPGFTEQNPVDTRLYVDGLLAHEMTWEPFQRQLGAVTAYARHGVSERLEGIGAPTLVIHGSEDRVIPLGNGRHLAEHLPEARLSVYEGVGHLPHLESSERFNREVVDFLGQRSL